MSPWIKANFPKKTKTKQKLSNKQIIKAELDLK